MPGSNGNENGNANENSSADITGDIISVRTDRQVSALESFLSILYMVSGTPDGTNVDAFFVPVTGVFPNFQEAGSRVTIATGIAVGSNQAFNFEPAISGPGEFLVGLEVTPPGGETIDILSAGRIQVLGPPDPRFIQPVDSVTTVQRGDDVFVSFDAGDPEDNAQWRLFLLAEADSRATSADLLGEEISTGTGNVGSAIISTSDLEPGDYQLGLSATDSGDSVVRTATQGDPSRIITITNGPVIRVVEVLVE